MKKRIIVCAGLVLAVCSVSAVAYAGSDKPWTKNTYRVSNLEDNSNTVSTFTDGDTKCYVLSSNAYYNSGANSISCVRQ